MEPIGVLSQIVVVLFVGLIVGIIAKKLKLPSMLLLILTGAVLKTITFNHQPIISFSTDFLISTSLLALVMIVFAGSSNFTYRELDTYSESALKIAVLFLVLNMLFLSVSVYYFFSVGSMFLSLLFAAVMSGTDPGSVLTLFQTKTNRIIEILKFESVINTPIVVLIPFIILDLMEFDAGISTGFLEYLFPFLQQIITGIGTGVVVGIIVFRFMKKFYSQKLSPFTLITSALLTYILSESLGGNGVLAVTVLGIFFGNVTVKKKVELQEFSSMLSSTLEILVFILIGFLIPLNLDPPFILKSIVLFMIMILIRFMAMQLVYLRDHVNLKERIFMALNCTKGIAVAVVAFIISNYVLDITVIEEGIRLTHQIPLMNFPGTQSIIDLMVLFILYSILVSSIIARFSKKFIRVTVDQDQ
ncbi:cation:proton antiporter [Candidatus Woesearchaeota archaeon]|nr:cation:proton antiporter [Candidatus Woesearchaeota archaeon]